MSTGNIMQFQGSIQKMINIVGIRKRLVMQKVALDLESKITKGTPRKTGTAAASWDLTEGAPSQRLDLHEGAKDDEIPLPEPSDVSGITGELPVYIISNLPYIEPLENGHSQQAPNGMVRLAMQAEADELDKVVRSIK